MNYTLFCLKRKIPGASEIYVSIWLLDNIPIYKYKKKNNSLNDNKIVIIGNWLYLLG